MTRIVSGFARSLRLEVPRTGTRPTSDRVREAMFSALEARDLLDNAVVLDLYAGSGALGLEAASRGAAHVVLVEKNPKAAALCSKNARAIRDSAPRGVQPRIDIVSASVSAYLERTTVVADLALLDPPYDLTESALATVLTALVGHAAPGAVIMVERDTRSPEPSWPDGVTLDRSTSYGETVLWWAERDADSDSHTGADTDTDSNG